MKKTKVKFNWRMAIFIFILLVSTVVVLVNFHQGMELREYEVQLEALMEYSKLDAVIVERTLEGYLSTMEGMASFLGTHMLDMEEGMMHLKRAAQTLDFRRLGLVDEDGVLWATDGSKVSISDRQYLQEMKESKSYVITESENSRITGQEIFVIAMPIVDNEGLVQGILHGAVRLDDFDPYKSIESEEAKRYIQIIDKKGNYIIGNDYRNGGMPMYDTFFEGLDVSSGDIPADDIIDRIQREETILTERNYEGTDYIEYLQPLNLNDWYVVTSLKKDDVTHQVNRFLANDIYPLILKTICIIILACGIVIYYLQKMGNIELAEEENLRTQLLSGADGFLVVDIQEDRILQGTEALMKPYGAIGMSFTELMRFWEQERIPVEYQRYIQNTMSLDAMVADFRKGIKAKIVEYPFREDSGKTGWTECEVKIEEKLEEKDSRLIAYNIYRDISAKKQMELSLKEEAVTDFLTGLYNRSGCMKKMDQLLQSGQKEGRKHAFVLFDLDNFKAVNDKLGHSVGDRALKDVADILKNHFRTYDTVCRLGGDEFVVLITDISDDAIEKKMSGLLDKLHLTYKEGAESVRITASAGIALIPDHGKEFEKIYEKADEALYRVKANGKDSFEVFSEKS